MRRYPSSAGRVRGDALAADIPIREVILTRAEWAISSAAARCCAPANPPPGFQGFRHERRLEVAHHFRTEWRQESPACATIRASRWIRSWPIFRFKIDGQASLALFLDQMKGAKVELKYGAETISGTVVSGRVVKADDKQPEREQLVALLDSGELRTLDLAAASSIRFADPKLQDSASRLLDRRQPIALHR
jgi:hypothetical protein